ncbi:Fibroin heavy chain precursor [hydrothermal vent metagenome]|uniref:Fibroin heavy chain n=1 Tax=hydrothermal vent metagenome TaxID=652676 RepID=A0A3B0Y3N1_9ZZZZ
MQDQYPRLKSLFLKSLVCLFLLISTQASAQEKTQNQWPQEITTDKGTVIIYQPQPESLKEDQLKARAAISIELKNSDKPVFGAIWFNARLQINRTERSALIADINVINVRIPEAGDKKLTKLKSLLEQEIPKWNMRISMEQLLETLKLEDQRNESAQKINTAPPEIIFMAEPAILITIDGEPKLQRVPSRSLERIINTAFTIVFDPSEKLYYLNADKKVWYTTKDLNADWKIEKDIPRGIAELAPKEDPNNKNKKEKKSSEEDESKPGPAPKIIVRTKPAELISATGKPEFKPIKGTKDLLYMSNTDSDVLMDINKQKYYVLLAGRWYISSKMQGPWKYVPAKSLPKYFADIPEDSNMGSVLYAVPGTDVAKNAVLDAQIPQTAAINRSQASLKIEYDGEPVFKPILSTPLSYAVNTATPVIKIASNQFYAVDDAVWFTANSANGTWKIATSVPDVIYTIPADSPMYNITFVKIYKVEPKVIYVGYTPGYTYTYIYGPTIVYGTGYYYPGWSHHWYYPHPATWGYHARWNPYMGWGFGMSYSSGPFTFSIGYGGWYHGGWWGPHHYYGYRYAYRHGYRHAAYAGYRAGYRAGHRQVRTQNIYNSQRNKARARPITQPANRLQTRPANRANNVYADRKGNVHRKTNNGWQNRSHNSWQTAPRNNPSTKPNYQIPKQTRPSQQQLQRNHQSRQSGAQRSQNFNRSRGGMSGGGGRAGGGRRR